MLYTRSRREVLVSSHLISLVITNSAQETFIKEMYSKIEKGVENYA